MIHDRQITTKENSWDYFRLPLSEVEGRIQSEEARQTGRFGDDDLYLRNPDLPCEIQFCHHSDLHILFSQMTTMIKAIAADWQAKGLAPRDWIRDNDKWIEVS